MGKNELSVAQAMKYSRHDYMNDLQLLLMYLDMGKYQEARECILDRTEAMKRQAALQKLAMPQTEEWLITLGWRHPAILAQLYCEIETKIDSATLDEELSSYLEKLTQSAIEQIERYADCPTAIEVTSDEQNWSIRLTYSGLQARPDIPEHPSQLTVEVLSESDQWTITVSGQIGG